VRLSSIIAAIVTPMVLGYSFFAYWVFRDMGWRTAQRKQLLWFSGIYLTSVLVFALITYLLRSALKLL
jgi:putative flippase GtrA